MINMLDNNYLCLSFPCAVENRTAIEARQVRLA